MIFIFQVGICFVYEELLFIHKERSLITKGSEGKRRVMHVYDSLLCFAGHGSLKKIS